MNVREIPCPGENIELPAAAPGIKASMATSAGYSGTPLYKKLGYRDGMSIVAVGMPEDVRELIESGAGDIRWSSREIDVSAAHVFATRSSDLRQHLRRLRDS